MTSLYPPPTWHAPAQAPWPVGWQPPTPDPPPPKPERNPHPRCFMCGRFVRVPQYVLTRECPRCDVRWADPTPAEVKLRDVQREKELTGILEQYHIDGEGYLDHAAEHIPSPA